MPARNVFLILFAILVVPALVAPINAAQEPLLHHLPDSQLFPLPQTLKPNVQFWMTVYKGYDNNHLLLHDNLHLDVVYTVIDLSDLAGEGVTDTYRRLQRRKRIRNAETKYLRLLQELAAGNTGGPDAEEKGRIEQLFGRVSGGNKKYIAARSRLRTQTCLKNRFAEGIERSGLHMPVIERIFRDRGLPQELTRLPFVESLFHPRAHSTARAAGIWQFMPSTARRFMKINLEVDERWDPFRATEAAASYLAENHKSLRTWPLAITAYNHGPAGMRRAVRKIGSRDLGKIVERYKSRTFGFASRNFYAEFLAATLVYNNRESYFPGTKPQAVLRFDEHSLSHYVAATDLAKAAGTDLHALRTLNPALVAEIWSGDLLVPKGYTLRLPAERSATFKTAYNALPSERKQAHQAGFRYRVRRGDTLAQIAGRYGTSSKAIQRANRLRNPNRISIGQVLLIPPRRGGTVTASRPAARSKPQTHTVRRGETLTRIALRYGTTVQAILSANRLRNADTITIGQRLAIP